MYKLTYESEDDILDDNTDNLTKKLDNEIIIYDKEEKQHTWTTDSQNNERRSTMPSATSAAISIHNSRKSSMEKKKADGNFYSLFSNNFPVETSKKNKEARLASNCEYFLLIFYLIALTASVVVLFFYVKRIEDENSVLREHILDLTSLANSDTPIALKKTSKKQNCSGRNCCCDSYWKSLSKVKSRLSKTSDSLGSLQKISQESFANTARQLFKLEQKVENVSKQLTSDIKQLDGNLQIEALASAATSSQRDLTAKKQAIVFDAQRAVMGNVDTHQDDELLEINLLDRSRFALRYSHTAINLGRGLNESTGVFTAGLEGVYVFQVEFCTKTRAPETVTVQLQRNKAPARTFRVPITNSESVSYQLPVSYPSLPFLNAESSSDDDLARHHYTVIQQVKKGDQIQLVVTEGAIVELESRNGMESQSCSGFSGFLLS